MISLPKLMRAVNAAEDAARNESSEIISDLQEENQWLREMLWDAAIFILNESNGWPHGSGPNRRLFDKSCDINNALVLGRKLAQESQNKCPA